MIDPQTVQKILDAAKVEEVVRSYGVELRRAGSVLKGLCPFHDEKTPSFVVSPAKGIYKCFGCGKAGHAVGFVMEKEQCSYPEALRILARKYHIEVAEREMTPEQRSENMERQNILAINEWMADRLSHMLTDDAEARAVGLSYFRSRGFSDEMIARFRLGYSPDSNRIAREAKAAGFSEQIIVKSGIGGRSQEHGTLYDRFRGRVIFPILSLTGRVVAFGGRVIGPLSDEDKRRGKGKYVNSPEIAGIYEKNRELYGMFQAKQDIQRRDQCILVEGYADVISMHQAGMANTVAACGTAFTENQLNVIKRFTRNLIVMDDGDAAGISAAQKAARIALSVGMDVKMILLPDGSDPDDFARSHSAEVIEQYIRNEAMDFVAYKHRVLLGDNNTDPVQVKRALESVLDTIAILPDAMSKAIYTRRAAELFGIDEASLRPTIAQMEGNEADIRARAEEAERRREQAAKQAEAPKPVYKFALRERELVRFIVRHAQETVSLDTEAGPAECRVADLVLAALADLRHDDGHTFEDPIYQKFLDIIATDSVTSDTYFTDHPDPDVQQAAISLALDRETPSRIFDTPEEVFNTEPSDPLYARKKADYEQRRLNRHRQKVMNTLRTLVIEYKIDVVRDKQAQIKRLIDEQPDRLMPLMKELTDLKHTEQALQGQESSY